MPVSVGGISDPVSIANTFRDHFRISCKYDLPTGSNGEATMPSVQNQTFSASEIKQIITSMQRGKSPGHDGLSVEHLKNAGVHLPRVLSMLFTLCMRHSYLPEPLMRTLVVPVLKNKTGDVSDRENYRPISLATVTAKVLDSMINSRLQKYVNLHEAQFGFKAELSTESAILCLKHAVNYYTRRKTPVYACFLDLSRAFDVVVYNKLWPKLRDSGMPDEYISLLQYWYANQINQVRWDGRLSNEYKLECGVRQGGLSSPTLFNLYIDALIRELSGNHVGCYIDNVCINNISYADDMVLLSPSINGIRKLIYICEKYAGEHGLVYNCKKSELLIFKAGKKGPTCVPPVKLNGTTLKRVTSFKYLGHIVNAELNDDEDIERERRALAVRGNMVARRFARCTDAVKITLFKAFCQSFYTSSLWVQYTRRAISDLRVQYNNIFRILLALPRNCSASGMFAKAYTDGFHAIIRKKIASLLQRVRGSANGILEVIASRFDCPIVRHCVGVTLGGRI